MKPKPHASRRTLPVGRRPLLAFALAASIVRVACADAPVAAPDVHVGDLWHYRTTDGFTREAEVEFTHRVVDVSDREIKVQLKNKRSSGSEIRYFNRDWNSLDVGNTKFDPYYPGYKFPMSVGLAWKQEFRSTTTNGRGHSAFLSGKVTALENVTVPAGVFEAYRIESDIEAVSSDPSAQSSKGHKTTWYAPAVKNYVRSESTISSEGRVRSKSIDELVEYSLQDRPAPGH